MRSLLLAASLSLAFPMGASEFFVSPGGKAANPGTREAPFASLEQARDAIRRGKSSGRLDGAITVWIGPGDVVRTSPLELSKEDSGTEKNRVAYRGLPGTRLLGGIKVTNWAPLANADAKKRLPAAAREHVVQADLRAAGVQSFGGLTSRGFGRPMAPAHLELFAGGQPMTLARWPNEGQWERIAGFPESGGQGDEHGGKVGALTEGFNYAGDRPRNWASSQDVWVHGYWSWDWANSYERIASIDLDKRLIKTAPPHGLYGFRKGQRFCFLNVLEELDEPGEWFLDREQGLLYFWPPDQVKAQETLVSVLGGPFFKLTDVSHVSLQDLLVECGRGEGIQIRNGVSNLVSNCQLRLLGNSGISIAGGFGHGVRGCDIENTGDGGVSLHGGDRQTLKPSGFFVENCGFRKQGRWSKCYVPAIGADGVGHRLTHNLIQEHPHCGILFSGNDHVIEYNEIHHVALETGDVGAIYTGRDWTYRGNRIRFNYIHHTGGVGMGSMGVYMDDCVSGAEIYGNIFYKVSRAAFLGGGRDHRVINNLFVECQPSVQIDGRGLDKSPVWHNMVYDYMRQQLKNVPFELYASRYPEIKEVANAYEKPATGIAPEGNVVARNVSLGGKWLDIHWHAVSNLVQVTNNFEGDLSELAGSPESTRPELKKGSPAWKIGFDRIPVEKIGLQR